MTDEKKPQPKTDPTPPPFCPAPGVVVCPNGQDCYCVTTGGGHPRDAVQCKVSIAYPQGRPDQATITGWDASCSQAGYEIAIATILAGLLKGSGGL